MIDNVVKWYERMEIKHINSILSGITKCGGSYKQNGTICHSYRMIKRFFSFKQTAKIHEGCSKTVCKWHVLSEILIKSWYFCEFTFEIFPFSQNTSFQSLRKHAYSNILKILPPQNENFQIFFFYIFRISTQNIDCRYSLEPPRRRASLTDSWPELNFVNKL